MLIFCLQPNFFILKLKCVKVLELVFQKRVFPYYIWILIIYCSFKKKGVKLAFPYYIWILIMSPLRTKGDILVQSDFLFCFCFFSAKLVWTITCLSFQIGQLYLVCGCMTIRRCVTYHNDLRGTLTSRSNDCFLNSIFLFRPQHFFLSRQVNDIWYGCMTIRRCVTYCNDLRGTFDLEVK